MPQLLEIFKKKKQQPNNYIYEIRHENIAGPPETCSHASSMARGIAVSVCWSCLMDCHSILYRLSCFLKVES